jgi:Xaa-Pro dipeptidase
MKVPGIETARVAKSLTFSVAEYQDRLSRVRAQMAERRLDVLVVTTPENIHYLSGYETPGYYCKQCLLVPLAGEPIHLTRGTEETNAKIRSWIDRTDSYMDHEDPVALFAETLRADGFARSRVGVEKVSWFLTVADYEQLRALLPHAEIGDGSMLVEACRLIKSEAEIAYLRKAARAAEAGMTAALDAIRSGVTEDNVAAEVQRAVTNCGSEYPSLPVFVASGVRSSMAHATWAGRRLEPGDPVLIEISGCVKRYSAALMRTASVGVPSGQLPAMTAVSCRALEAMLEAIRPGRPLGEVWEVWAKAVSTGGFEGRFKRTGYSIGVNFPPDWGEGYILSFKQGETRLLRPNMTFHIPRPGHRRSRTRRGSVARHGCPGRRSSAPFPGRGTNARRARRARRR